MKEVENDAAQGGGVRRGPGAPLFLFALIFKLSLSRQQCVDFDRYIGEGLECEEFFGSIGLFAAIPILARVAVIFQLPVATC